jgi:hypothetical protein
MRYGLSRSIPRLEFHHFSLQIHMARMYQELKYPRCNAVGQLLVCPSYQYMSIDMATVFALSGSVFMGLLSFTREPEARTSFPSTQMAVAFVTNNGPPVWSFDWVKATGRISVSSSLFYRACQRLRTRIFT